MIPNSQGHVAIIEQGSPNPGQWTDVKHAEPHCWAEQILITLERGSEPSGTKYTTVRKRWEWKISCEQADVGVVRKLIIVFSEFLYCRIN